MLIITVHFPQRELIPKILLAHKAASQFGSSVIGRTAPIRKMRGQILKRKIGPIKLKYKIKQGVIFEVAATPLAGATHFPIFKTEGLNIVSFCEEATAFTDPKSFAKRRLDDDALDILDLFFSWGKWHQTTIDNSSLDKSKIVTSGHPRFEIYQSKFKKIFNSQINKIKDDYSDKIILINTNIPEFAISKRGFEERRSRLVNKLSKVGGDRLKDLGVSEKELFELIKNKKKSFENKVKIANKLMDDMLSMDFKVIMRPKPSVASSTLSSFAKKLGFQGIIDGRFSIVPWLHACTAVLHHNCTTGIEAAILNKPAIMFNEGEPVAKPVQDASIIAENVDQAVELLKSSLNCNIDKTILQEKLYSVRSWHENINASPSDNILSEIKKRGMVNKGNSIDLNKIHSKLITRNDYVPENWKLMNKPGKNEMINPLLISHVVKCLNDIFSTNITLSSIEEEIFLLKNPNNSRL